MIHSVPAQTQPAASRSAGSSSGYPPFAIATLAGSGVVTAVAAALSPSGDIVVLCGLAFCLVVALLWRNGEPPILLLPVLFQWSEVAIVPYATAWRDTTLNAQSFYGANLEASVVYGLLGVSAMALGMRLAIGRPGSTRFLDRIRQEALSTSFDRIVLIAGSTILLGHLFAGGARLGGGTTQIFLALANLQQAGLFVLVYWGLVRSEKLALIGAIIALEIAIGMTGFFAAFKDTILTVFVAAIAARPRIRLQDVLLVGAAGALIVSLATFWTAVKPGYRLLLNQGSGAQEVVVPVSQRLSYLFDRLMKMDSEEFADGFEKLVDRHGYTEFLGLVMAYVPVSLPHEAGQLTLNVLMHITVPRIIYPDKPPVPHDTDVMTKYSGLNNTWDSATSISIGHLGELYIDFGWLGGLLAMGVIGGLVGYIYRTVREFRSGSALMAAGLCTMAVLPIAYFGTAYIKLIGSFVMTTAAVYLMQRVVFPRLATALSQIRPA